MKFAAIASSTLLSLASLANADTYETFAISGTDSQEQSITSIGDPGCNKLACNNYAPGTFNGAATVDISTDTIVAATLTPCCSDSFSPSFATSALTPNIGSGLNLEILSAPFPTFPYLSLDFNLSSDTVSGFITGYTGGSGDSGASADYAMNMIGTLKPQSTTPAPEINSGATAGALTLMIGGLLVLRGRRRQL